MEEITNDYQIESVYNDDISDMQGTILNLKLNLSADKEFLQKSM